MTNRMEQETNEQSAPVAVEVSIVFVITVLCDILVYYYFSVNVEVLAVWLFWLWYNLTRSSRGAALST